MDSYYPADLPAHLPMTRYDVGNLLLWYIVKLEITRSDDAFFSLDPDRQESIVPAEEFGMDSLETLELIFELEKRFGCDFTDDYWRLTELSFGRQIDIIRERIRQNKVDR